MQARFVHNLRHGVEQTDSFVHELSYQARLGRKGRLQLERANQIAVRAHKQRQFGMPGDRVALSHVVLVLRGRAERSVSTFVHRDRGRFAPFCLEKLFIRKCQLEKFD